MNILIVEDEHSLAQDIASFLKKEDHTCTIATNYDEAVEKAMLYPHDCILLDIMLPDNSGLKLLELLKDENKDDGVLIISAKNSVDDRLKGLELGADDYISKPFHFAELNARIKAVYRRKKFKTRNTDIAFANLLIDLDNKCAFVNNKKMSLTSTEFNILQHLTANKNRVLSKISLAEYIWGEYVDHTDSFDFLFAHIKNLRNKLHEAGAEIKINSIYGVGYKMEEL